MPEPTIDELLAAEAAMDNSFAACGLVLLLKVVWSGVLMLLRGAAYGWPLDVNGALSLALLTAYLWFAVGVARVAARLGKKALLYLAWMLGAPVVGSLIGVPLVSGAIAASPLSLKWLLGSELRATIAARTFRE